MSTDLVRTKVQEVVDTIDRPDFIAQLRQALPASVSVEKFTRTTKLSIQLNPDILTADRQSLFLSMVRCAKDGLLPDGREAALVKVKVKGKDAVAYWPMVGGLRKIAAKHGFSLEAHAVYANDEFEWVLGYEPSVTHRPPALDQERGELMGAYAVATSAEGQKFLEVMGRGEIEKVRASSSAFRSGFGPWVDWPAEMFRKTVARRLFKQLPLGDLEEHEQRVAFPSESAVEVATSPVPAVAGLPLVEESAADQVADGDVVEQP